MSISNAITQECYSVSNFLADEPVTLVDTTCMASIYTIVPHAFVRGVLCLGLAQPVCISGAFGKDGKTVKRLFATVEAVQNRDIRVGDTVLFGLDAADRPCVASVDMTRRSPDALPYVCPPEHQLPPVDMADYD